MVRLEKVFARFPKLTGNQRTELARRRIVRFFSAMPEGQDWRVDVYYALGFMGTKDLFRSYKEEVHVG